MRQDPHRLVTMLLSKVRMLATFAAVLALAAAVVMASNNQDGAHDWLWALFAASLIPTSLISASWLLALRRFLCRNQKARSTSMAAFSAPARRCGVQRGTRAWELPTVRQAAAMAG